MHLFEKKGLDSVDGGRSTPPASEPAEPHDRFADEAVAVATGFLLPNGGNVGKLTMPLASQTTPMAACNVAGSWFANCCTSQTIPSH